MSLEILCERRRREACETLMAGSLAKVTTPKRGGSFHSNQKKGHCQFSPFASHRSRALKLVPRNPASQPRIRRPLEHSHPFLRLSIIPNALRPRKGSILEASGRVIWPIRASGTDSEETYGVSDTRNLALMPPNSAVYGPRFSLSLSPSFRWLDEAALLGPPGEDLV